MFDELYGVRTSERTMFGQHWCGPDRFPHGEKVLVARYLAVPEGDGSSVDVYVEAMPARFYTVRAGGFELTFGSGQGELAAKVAKMLATGMLTIRRAKWPACPVEAKPGR